MGFAHQFDLISSPGSGDTAMVPKGVGPVASMQRLLFESLDSETCARIGPLHGLPVSLKDNFNITGKTSATGFCAWADEPMQKDSTIVQILRELGAVAYVKTNVPTAMMIAESVNNCYGR